VETSRATTEQTAAWTCGLVHLDILLSKNLFEKVWCPLGEQTQVYFMGALLMVLDHAAWWSGESKNHEAKHS
jgi:hypothetical protein